MTLSPLAVGLGITLTWQAAGSMSSWRRHQRGLTQSGQDLLVQPLDSDVYAGMVRDAHRERLFHYYRIDGGNHVDCLYDAFPDRLRPILRCFRSAFVALDAWVDDRVAPPAGATIPRPASGDLANTCALRS